MWVPLLSENKKENLTIQIRKDEEGDDDDAFLACIHQLNIDSNELE